MSRGLGRVQRTILQRLADCGGECDLQRLVVMVFYPERFEYMGEYGWHCDIDDWQTSLAEYATVQRAVKRLETLGRVRGRYLCNQWKEGSGGCVRWKTVALSVVFKDNCP